MKTTTNFEKDLIDSCASAAEFLRKKDEKYNEDFQKPPSKPFFMTS